MTGRITESQNGQNFAFEICIRAITLRSCYMKKYTRFRPIGRA